MAAPILVTKLFIPPPRAKLVHRPVLIERLIDGLDRKLTLLSAPAGFGKTTLVSAWVENVQEKNQIDGRTMEVAWLSLDEDDNDLVRFLTYFVTALNQISGNETGLGRGALSMLQSPQPPSANTILISLINEVASIPEKILFVLDDYHLVEAEPIHQALVFLLENLPPQLHLVIATRQDPHLPLGRLRARDQMTELRAADLRFTISEAGDFLNQVMGLNLTSKQIADLETRTEGWIAGLQLAAISMQRRQDHTGFIKSFTGGHRLVLEFLIEEVLDQQPESIQNFLLRTSVLSRLTGSLCDALTDQENSREILEMLDHANLFIIPLDDERVWYRYHHLFVDLLRQRLIFHNEEVVNELHAKAAIWYETNGDLSEAVHHALAGKDTKSAIRLIEKGALAALENSDFRFILESVDLLPESAVQNAPWLSIYHAWALLLTSQVEAATPKLENLDRLLEFAKGDREIQQREMLGNIAGLKVIYAAWMSDYKNLTEYANQVRQYFPENNWIRAYCAMVMGGFFWGKGNLEAAADAFAESASAGNVSGNPMVAISATCNLAHSVELEGHLQQAVELFINAFELAKQDGDLLPGSGYIHVDFGRVLYELNEVDRAEQQLKEGLRLCRQLADGRAEKIGYFLLAKVQIAKGEYEKARTSIRKGETAIPNPKVSFDLRGSEYPQVRLWLKENNLTALHSWLEENDHTARDGVHFKTILTFTMHARVQIALGREYSEEPYLQNAQDLLEELFEMAEKNGWGSRVIEILCLQALAVSLQEEDSDHAIGKLEQAIVQAEPEGFIRTFVDEGPPMASLLYEALKQEISPEYVKRLLNAFPVAEPKETASTKPQGDQSGLIDPLSDREIEVLELIAKGLTNQVIAARLILSPHTIKTHTRNIYSKLAVNNRTQAVDKARTLGILPLTPNP